jgi:outer membrane protein TolC
VWTIPATPERMRKLGLLLSVIAGASVGPAVAARADEQPAPPRITLDDAVRRAVARNPTALVADQEIRRAEALVREARATWYPTLVGTGTYTHLDAQRTQGTTIILAQDALNANVALTVPLLASKYWAQSSHASDTAEALRISAIDIKRQVALAVGHAYLAILAQRRVVSANELARNNAKEHFDFAHQRFAGGIGNRLDEVRAQQALATDEARLQASIAGLTQAREALGVLIGADAPVDAGDDPQFADAGDTATALQDAAKRPDIVALETRVRAADRVVKDGWTDYAPTLLGIAQAFYQNPPTPSLPLTGWQAQLVLSVPFYDGGLRYGLAQERDSLASEARANLEAGLRQARSDVRAAFEAVRRADEALKAARDAAQLAKQALDLTQLAYRAGATTNIEVIDAQRSARDADTEVAVALDAAQQARLDVLAATGRFP